MPTPRQTVEAFMAAFMDAWPVGDAARVASFFSDDAAYHNGPLAPVRGRSAIRATVAEFMALGGAVDVEVVHVVDDGPLVMIERVDRFTTADGGSGALPVAGVFEVRDGLITAWRDYFDLAQVASLSRT